MTHLDGRVDPQRARHRLARDHGAGLAVVEDHGHPVIGDLQVPEQPQDVPSAAQAGELGRDDEHHVAGQVTNAERGLAQGAPEIDDDVAERAAQRADRGRDLLGREQL